MPPTMSSMARTAAASFMAHLYITSLLHGHYAIHFGDDGFGGSLRIGGAGNGASDDDVGGAGFDCFCRRDDSCLIPDVAASGTHARSDDAEAGAEFAAQCAGFLGGGHNAPAT